MAPKGIPVDGLTHVNFAFAYIEPGTYKVTTMDGNTPANLFRDVADVASMKSGNSGLQVFVSIGGWTFSDPGTPTQPLFGEIAADATKRKTFADNVVAFMELYGFDGVDLDW
jgi:chitinase